MLVITAILAIVHMKRVFKIFLTHINKLILFERTKSDRVLYILCSSKTAKFDYILTFELGNATPSLNLNTTYIDFQLQAPDKTLVTQGRILGKLLKLTSIIFNYF